MLQKVKDLVLDPYPLRTIIRQFIKKFGSYEQCVKMGAVDRPEYGYCVYNAAFLASKLGYKRISVLEFGVAKGVGLLNLEYHAGEATRLFGVEIEIYGFDTGEGLPEPVDYRDLPYHWKKGFYKMDVPGLQAKLKNAKLVLGDVRDTSKDFFEKYNPAPIAAISYDLDFYSSTVFALKMLEADEKYYLPRIFCYFDDVLGTEIELYNDFIGERLAIHEFNQSHDNIKLGLPYHFLQHKVTQPWFNKIWIGHLFKHSRYNDFVSNEGQ